MAVRIGRKAASLSDSLTLAIDARYKALIQAGEDAVSFGTGEPDFPTPAPVCEAGGAGAGVTDEAVLPWLVTSYPLAPCGSGTSLDL